MNVHSFVSSIAYMPPPSSLWAIQHLYSPDMNSLLVSVARTEPETFSDSGLQLSPLSVLQINPFALNASLEHVIFLKDENHMKALGLCGHHCRPSHLPAQTSENHQCQG